MNENIIFKNLNAEEQSTFEKVNNLIAKSKIYIYKECSSALKDAFIDKDSCIDDYTIIYVYNEKPILIDQKKMSFIRAYISDGSESTTIYNEKSRIYITDWDRDVFFGRKEISSRKGINYYTDPYYYKKEIEQIIAEK